MAVTVCNTVHLCENLIMVVIVLIMGKWQQKHVNQNLIKILDGRN